MKQENISMFLDQMRKVFCEHKLNALGKSLGYAKRERKITPARLVLAGIKAFSCSKVETIADVQRAFNAMFNEDVAYKPFHNQLAKIKFGEFMREVTNIVFEHIMIQTLGFNNEGNMLAEFDTIYIQDGTSFGVKDSLREVFPGRFTTIKPAAVELHVTYDLCHEMPVAISLTPDKDSEKAELPEARDLCNCLIMADCGYPNTEYFTELQLNKGSYLMRMNKAINPFVIDRRKREIKKHTERPLKRVKQKLSKKKVHDFDVVFRDDKTNTTHRLIVRWNNEKKEYMHLITNLPRERYTAEAILDIYRLRWQIELAFKEWKSYANLHAFDTSNESIVEGFIWFAIIAALIKRFMAHTTQVVKKVETSTRKVAMCVIHVLPDIFKCLAKKRRRALEKVFCTAIEYLSRNALRAHPKRDREKGRLKIGLEPVFHALKN